MNVPDFYIAYSPDWEGVPFLEIVTPEHYRTKIWVFNEGGARLYICRPSEGTMRDITGDQADIWWDEQHRATDIRIPSLFAPWIDNSEPQSPNMRLANRFDDEKDGW